MAEPFGLRGRCLSLQNGAFAPAPHVGTLLHTNSALIMKKAGLDGLRKAGAGTISLSEVFRVVDSTD